MTSLREQLGKFIAELRTAGVRVSVAESIDAMNAVAAAGLEQIRMREALAAALIKDEADRASFDEIFGRFFAAPSSRGGQRRHPDHRGMQQSSAAGQGRPGENPALEQKRKETEQKKQQGEARPAARRPTESARERSGDEKMKGPASPAPVDPRAGTLLQKPFGGQAPAPRFSPEKENQEEGIEGARMARMREIERRPFSAYTDLEFDQARDALKPLERRFRIRVGRRLRLARRGRVDFRRTIRAGIQRGGLLAELKFRSRRPRHVDLLILADISGSVRYAAELMLELVAGAKNCFRRVRSFVYIDHLAEAEFEQGHLVTTPPVDMYARSDFGRVLVELWDRRPEVINRQTLVVILGDARNNRRPARADLLREIARSCRGVVWLNPEDQSRWGSGDSAIEQYRAVVTALYPSGNLGELERALVRAC